MDYRHLSLDELVRHIGTQVGNDLELEGELVRRVVAGEVVLAKFDDEKDEEIEDLKKEVAELEGRLSRAARVVREIEVEMEKLQVEVIPDGGEDEEEVVRA